MLPNDIILHSATDQDCIGAMWKCSRNTPQKDSCKAGPRYCSYKELADCGPPHCDFCGSKMQLVDFNHNDKETLRLDFGQQMEYHTIWSRITGGTSFHKLIMEIKCVSSRVASLEREKLK